MEKKSPVVWCLCPGWWNSFSSVRLGVCSGSIVPKHVRFSAPARTPVRERVCVCVSARACAPVSCCSWFNLATGDSIRRLGSFSFDSSKRVNWANLVMTTLELEFRRNNATRSRKRVFYTPRVQNINKSNRLVRSCVYKSILKGQTGGVSPLPIQSLTEINQKDV